MNAKTILSIFLSILVGLYIGFHFTLFSGMNPLLDKIFLAITVVVFIVILVLIFKEPNRKFKIIQSFVLIIAIVFGLYKAKKSFESLTAENPRTYYKTDTELEK